MPQENQFFHKALSQGEEEELARRYARLVQSCVRPYFLTGGDYDDLVQEGMIGLLKAIREYDPARSQNFEAFAALCIRRQVYDALRRSKRKDGHLHIEYVEQAEGDGEGLPHGSASQDPEAQFLAKESAWEIQKALSGLLSAFETAVLRSYLEGYTSSEIAEVLHRTPEAVENAIGRIRRKLAKYLQQGRQQD